MGPEARGGKSQLSALTRKRQICREVGGRERSQDPWGQVSDGMLGGGGAQAWAWRTRCPHSWLWGPPGFQIRFLSSIKMEAFSLLMVNRTSIWRLRYHPW